MTGEHLTEEEIAQIRQTHSGCYWCAHKEHPEDRCDLGEVLDTLEHYKARSEQLEAALRAEETDCERLDEALVQAVERAERLHFALATIASGRVEHNCAGEWCPICIARGALELDNKGEIRANT